MYTKDGIIISGQAIIIAVITVVLSRQPSKSRRIVIENCTVLRSTRRNAHVFFLFFFIKLSLSIFISITLLFYHVYAADTDYFPSSKTLVRYRITIFILAAPTGTVQVMHFMCSIELLFTRPLLDDNMLCYNICILLYTHVSSNLFAKHSRFATVTIKHDITLIIVYECTIIYVYI